MASCPLQRISVSDLSTKIWEQATPEEQASLTSPAELAYLISGTQSQGGLNLGYDKPARGEAQETKWKFITRFEASRFLDDYYANKIYFQSTKIFAESLSMFFFDGRIHKRNFEKKSTPAAVQKCSDGDTCRVTLGDNTCPQEEASIRFSGIDTPESAISAKFRNQLFAFLREWKTSKLVQAADMPSEGEIMAELTRRAAPAERLETYLQRFPNHPLVTLLARRMVFDGKVATTVMHGLIDGAQRSGLTFSLEESFIRGVNPSDKQGRCDLINAYDIYGRRIGILHVSSPSFIGSFISSNLPNLGNYDPILQELRSAALSQKEKDFLTTTSPEMKKLLDPKSYPTWRELFPSEKIGQISTSWRQYATGDRATDINMAMVATGVAFSYTKYRMQHSGDYNKVETAAQVGDWGLWKSMPFSLLDPQGKRHLVDSECSGGSCGQFAPFTPPHDCLTGQ